MEFVELIAQVGSAAFILVEVIKKAGLPTRFAPLAAVVIGGVLGALVSPEWTTGIVLGLISAASAMGVYSGTKKTFEVNPELK